MRTKKYRHIHLSPSHARVPEALAPFLLVPDRPLRYRWWTRIGDFWAGRRDRTGPVRDAEPAIAVADTPWLRRLMADCANAVATGRARTEALVSVLDRERASLRAEIDQAKHLISSLTDELTQLESAPLTGDAVGPGEMYSPSDERLRRRRHERNLRAGAMTRQLSGARDRLRQARQQLEVVEQERRSHWIVLQERARVLTEHHQRRAATYTRGLENRRGGQYWAVPGLEIPAWARAELGSGGNDDEPLAPILALTGTSN